MIWLFILFFFLFPSPVLAYLDPGTGSYFIQILIASLLGAFYLTKAFWFKLLKNLKAFFKNFLKTKK